MSGAEAAPAAKPKAVFAGTVLRSIAIFMGPHIRALDENFDVVLVSGDLGRVRDYFPGHALEPVEIDIPRQVSPFRDLKAVLRLAAYLRRNRVEVVHSITPKGGLVAMAAGFLARTPFRFHMFTGQVWVTRRGVWRWLLARVDALIAMLATHVHADSPSQRDFLVAQGVVGADRISVLADGSVSGVDMKRFRPDAAARQRIRSEHGIGEEETVFLFLGRLSVDKGIADLIAAFDAIGGEGVDAHLMVVGPDEAGFVARVEALAARHPGRVHICGTTDEPETYMAAADVHCLPSYREGFGNTVIETASVGIPSIVSEIYGLTDAVVKGRTGLMHAPGDVEGLAAAMRTLATDRRLCLQMGQNAAERVEAQFTEARLVEAMLGFYASFGLKGSGK